MNKYPRVRVVVGVSAIAVVLGFCGLSVAVWLTRWEQARDEAVTIVRTYEAQGGDAVVTTVHPDDRLHTERLDPPPPPPHLKAAPVVFDDFNGGEHDPCSGWGPRCSDLERAVERPVGDESGYAVVLSPGGPDSVLVCAHSFKEGPLKGQPIDKRPVFNLNARLVDLRQHKVVATETLIEPCNTSELSVANQYMLWIKGWMAP